MSKWVCELIGLILWVIFIKVVAPDLSYVRSLGATIIGMFAIIFLAGSAPSSLFSKSHKEQESVKSDFHSSN